MIMLVAITTLWLIMLNTDSRTNNNTFEINDTSSITKIFLADKSGNTITLTKNNNFWLINNQFRVRKDAIATILSTANQIRVKKPVSKSAFEKVVKSIATTGVYVEFFKNKKVIKSYWIGSNTADHLGTYMLLKNSKEPFIVHIPSFNGFLSPRYGIQGNVINELNWRSNIVFNKSFESINHIKYTDYINPENSYFFSKDPMQLINYKNESIAFNRNKILTLLNSFENLNCEVYKSNKLKINSTTQIEELIVNFDTLRTYKISELNIKKKKDNFTVDRKYATLNNGELMLIQDYVFNKVLINIKELTK